MKDLIKREILRWHQNHPNYVPVNPNRPNQLPDEEYGKLIIDLKKQFYQNGLKKLEMNFCGTQLQIDQYQRIKVHLKFQTSRVAIKRPPQMQTLQQKRDVLKKRYEGGKGLIMPGEAADCKHCGLPGHTQLNCPNSARKCFRCGGNHWVKFCPTPKEFIVCKKCGKSHLTEFHDEASSMKTWKTRLLCANCMENHEGICDLGQATCKKCKGKHTTEAHDSLVGQKLCWYCGENNHWKAQCPARNNKQKCETCGGNHLKKACWNNPRLMMCNNCSEINHTTRDCNYEPALFYALNPENEKEVNGFKEGNCEICYKKHKYQDCPQLEHLAQRCWNCLKFGHNKSECVLSDRMAKEISAADRIMANVECEFCNVKGHVGNLCPIKNIVETQKQKKMNRELYKHLKETVIVEEEPIKKSTLWYQLEWCTKCNKHGHTIDVCREGGIPLPHLHSADWTSKRAVKKDEKREKKQHRKLVVNHLCILCHSNAHGTDQHFKAVEEKTPNLIKETYLPEFERDYDKLKINQVFGEPDYNKLEAFRESWKKLEKFNSNSRKLTKETDLVIAIQAQQAMEDDVGRKYLKAFPNGVRTFDQIILALESNEDYQMVCLEERKLRIKNMENQKRWWNVSVNLDHECLRRWNDLKAEEALQISKENMMIQMQYFSKYQQHLYQPDYEEYCYRCNHTDHKFTHVRKHSVLTTARNDAYQSSIIVMNLGLGVTKILIWEHFHTFGEPQLVTMFENNKTGESHHMAIVRFKHQLAANAAVNQTVHLLNNKPVFVLPYLTNPHSNSEVKHYFRYDYISYEKGISELVKREWKCSEIQCTYCKNIGHCWDNCPIREGYPQIRVRKDEFGNTDTETVNNEQLTCHKRVNDKLERVPMTSAAVKVPWPKKWNNKPNEKSGILFIQEGYTSAESRSLAFENYEDLARMIIDFCTHKKTYFISIGEIGKEIKELPQLMVFIMPENTIQGKRWIINLVTQYLIAEAYSRLYNHQVFADFVLDRDELRGINEIPPLTITFQTFVNHTQMRNNRDLGLPTSKTYKGTWEKGFEIDYVDMDWIGKKLRTIERRKIEVEEYEQTLHHSRVLKGLNKIKYLKTVIGGQQDIQYPPVTCTKNDKTQLVLSEYQFQHKLESLKVQEELKVKDFTFPEKYFKTALKGSCAMYEFLTNKDVNITSKRLLRNWQNTYYWGKAVLGMYITNVNKWTTFLDKEVFPKILTYEATVKDERIIKFNQNQAEHRARIQELSDRASLIDEDNWDKITDDLGTRRRRNLREVETFKTKIAPVIEHTETTIHEKQWYEKLEYHCARNLIEEAKDTRDITENLIDKAIHIYPHLKKDRIRVKSQEIVNQWAIDSNIKRERRAKDEYDKQQLTKSRSLPPPERTIEEVATSIASPSKKITIGAPKKTRRTTSFGFEQTGISKEESDRQQEEINIKFRQAQFEQSFERRR